MRGRPDRERVRIAIVTESFLPQVNGVTNSVLRVCEQLAARGHTALVLAPGPGPTSYAGARVVRTPSLPLPGYRDFRLSRPWAGLSEELAAFAPDVVHLASPAVLGAQAAFASRRLGLPVTARPPDTHPPGRQLFSSGSPERSGSVRPPS